MRWPASQSIRAIRGCFRFEGTGDGGGAVRDFMNADFLAVLEFWEREKGINRETLVGAVQESLF